jgi:hypothetical protein
MADGSALGNTGAREVRVGGVGATNVTGAEGASDVGIGWEECYPFTGCASSSEARC